MEIVPIQAVPDQTLEVILGGQATTLELRQLSTGLFINIQVENVEIVGFTACQNLNRIVRDSYLGFEGDLVFLDNTGAGEDPNFAGLGTQFSLVYLSVTDLPPGVG